MAAIGYSGTPLYKKLGFKPGLKIIALNAPQNYSSLFEDAPFPLPMQGDTAEKADIVHWFLTEQAELKLRLAEVIKLIPKNGAIWFSWPKKSSGKPTDLDENTIRNTILEAGLVDVKVCAIDEIWSGLKVVYRLKDR